MVTNLQFLERNLKVSKNLRTAATLNGAKTCRCQKTSEQDGTRHTP